MGGNSQPEENYLLEERKFSKRMSASFSHPLEYLTFPRKCHFVFNKLVNSLRIPFTCDIYLS